MIDERLIYEIDFQTKEAVASIKKVNNALEELKNKNNFVTSLLKSSWVQAGATFLATSFTIKEVTQAYEVQLKAETKLATALKATAGIGQMTLQQWKDFASALQNVTTVGDETTLSLIAFLKTLKLTDGQIKKVITTAIDLSTATGMTLEEAVKNLARTYSGLAGELGETIPALRNLTQEEMKAGKAVDLVAEAVRGQARAWAETALGELEQASNAFGDVKEEAGKFFSLLLKRSGIVPKLTKLFANLASELDNLVVKFKEVDELNTVGDLKTKLKQEEEAIKEFQDKLRNTSRYSPLWGEYNTALQEHWNKRNAILAKIEKLEKEHKKKAVTIHKAKSGKIIELEEKVQDKLKKLRMDAFNYSRYLAKKELEENLKKGVDKKLAYELYHAELRKIAEEEAKYREALEKKTKDKVIATFREEEKEREQILSEFEEAYVKSKLNVYDWEEYQIAKQYLKYAKYVKDKKKLDEWAVKEIQKIEKQRQEDIQKAREKATQEAEKQYEKLHELDLKIKDSFTSTFGQGLKEALLQGKISFKDFVNNILADLARVVVEDKISKMMSSINFGFSGFFAQGGIIGQPERFAQGGVIDRPRLYKGALVGERNRAEAVLPLVKTSGGDLGVKAVTGGDVKINIINKTTSPITAKNIYTATGSDGERIVNVVIEGIYKNHNGLRDIIKGVK